MHINSKADLEMEIARLGGVVSVKRKGILEHIEKIEQFFNPANQLRKFFVRRKQKQPLLVDGLIDESVTAVADEITRKINLPGQHTFIGSKMNAVTHNAFSKLLYSNAYKLKAIGRAIVKNLFS